MRRPPAGRIPVMPARPAREARIHFGFLEIASILVSIVTMALAFQMFGVSDSGIILGVVLGITAHEISHKLVAQAMGFESRYKLWSIGLVLVVAFAIISRGRFIFAAPGFVVTEGMASIRERGIISLSAPAANILLAALFLLVGGVWAVSAAYVNVLLAAFNLLPVGPLDGSPVMEWNPAVWASGFGLTCLLGAIMII